MHVIFAVSNDIRVAGGSVPQLPRAARFREIWFSTSGVQMYPGLMQLAPCSAHSSTSTLVSPAKPCLAATLAALERARGELVGAGRKEGQARTKSILPAVLAAAYVVLPMAA